MSDPFYAFYVGAGRAMFGTDEGPWDIARRLEHRLGPRLKVVAVMDVSADAVKAQLEKKMASNERASYQDAKSVTSVKEAKALVDRGEIPSPKAIFVATPPRFRGGLSPQNCLEKDLMESFPEAHIFLEKPVATGAPWEKSVEEAKEVGRMLARHKGVVSVGYVLRYLDAVREMKRILEENNLTVMSTLGRYVTAYPMSHNIGGFWNKSISQGPIIEQGTHIVDLSRYFGGEIDLDTLTAQSLGALDPAGKLSKLAFDESEVPADLRIPRATTASWKYESGAVGAMLHGTALHGRDYAIELEVYADGYQLILMDPFGKNCTLSVRGPESDTPVITSFAGDDPYQHEIDGFLDTIEGGSDPRVLATFESAAATYETTWAIRNASEESARRVKEKKAAPMK